MTGGEQKPRIAISMGDPGGIGAEVVAGALADPAVRESCEPTIVGERPLLRVAARALAVDADAIDCVPVRELGLSSEDDLGAGGPDARRGQASFEYLEEAVRLVINGEADAVVTGPINKAAWQLAGRSYPGQTEVLAELTESDDYAMMLASGPIRSVLVTTHIPLTAVPGEITQTRVERKVRLAHRALGAFVDHAPVIATAGLNPHAGEDGLFGTEERELISPAVDECQREGIDVVGPLPADTVYCQAREGRYDAVVAMYHDQGLIPVKLFGFDHGINVTLGLPIVRTSPDHGTAFDIAGRGSAQPTSMIEAILAAGRLVRHGKRTQGHG